MKLSRRKLIVLGATGLLGAGWYLAVREGDYSGPVLKKRYVDMHRHLVPGPFSLGKSIESQIEATLRWMAAHNVEQSVVQMAVYIEENEPYDSAAVRQRLDLFRPHANVLIPFIAMHPNTPHSHTELLEIFAEVKEQGVLGFGEFKIKDFAVNDSKCMALYAACEEAGLPVLIHIDHKHCYDVPGLPGLEEVLKTFPNQPFVGHAQGWWASISTDPQEQDDLGDRPKTPVQPGGAIQRLMDTYPNLYGDLAASSGLNAVTRDPAYTASFFEKYQDRLMFGTDTAAVLIKNWGHFEVYEALDMPEPIESKILRANARRVFKLPSLG
jgi:predicted TIM-barrel fold metal-dependent hydrolase